jgi:hypothetical protein
MSSGSGMAKGLNKTRKNKRYGSKLSEINPGRQNCPNDDGTPAFKESSDHADHLKITS